MRKLLIITIIIFNVSLAFAQTQKYDIMTYTPPTGWTVQNGDNAKVFTKIDKAKNTLGIIMLYPSINSSGDANDDFKYVWKQIVQSSFGASANPEIETGESNGFKMVNGGELIKYEGIQALAMLTVLSGKGKAISILTITNEAGYMVDVQKLVDGIAVNVTEPLNTIEPDQNANSDSRPTSIIGDWSDSGAILASYVNGSGQYVGDASSATSTAYKFQANGKYESFFANTKAFKTDTYLYRGSYKLSGNTITLTPTFYERRTNTKIQPNNDPNNMKKLTFSYSFEKNTDRNIWGIRFEGDDDNFVGNGLLYRAK